MSVQFPYRAVICGEEHIVKGWRGRKLLTDRGSFSIRHLYGDWQIQAARLLEVALIQTGENRQWLLNGKNLRSLQLLPLGTRLDSLTRDEILRVCKEKICAVAWFQTSDSDAVSVTELLDKILTYWEIASEPDPESIPDSGTRVLKLWRKSCLDLDYHRVFAAWGKPVWLTEFRPAAQKTPISPQQKQLARLHKAEAAANDTLKEALSKWMKFDPPGMSATTKARITKAVQMYSTDPEKRSLKKIGDEFGVSRKTVSVWFKQFTAETGYAVVTHHRHVSVKEQLKPCTSAWDRPSDADSEQDEGE